MWKDFETAEKKMFDACEGCTVIMWGYGMSGWFIEHLFRRSDRTIDFIVDDNVNIMAYRSYYIRFFSPDTTRIIISFSNDDSVTEYLEGLGYKKGESFFFVKDLFMEGSNERFSGYEKWLEQRYGLDITSVPSEGTKKADINSHNYHWGIDFIFMDAFESLTYEPDDAVFDFGFGKAGALFLFEKCGVRKLGGVEYDESLFSAAKNNFEKMGLPSNGLIHADACTIREELDEYNIFFLYDPFEGDMLDTVIRNIEESGSRKKRKITLIYASPSGHRTVIKNGKFRLTDKMEARCLTYPGINIYSMIND